MREESEYFKSKYTGSKKQKSRGSESDPMDDKPRVKRGRKPKNDVCPTKQTLFPITFTKKKEQPPVPPKPEEDVDDDLF